LSGTSSANVLFIEADTIAILVDEGLLYASLLTDLWKLLSIQSPLILYSIYLQLLKIPYRIVGCASCRGIRSQTYIATAETGTDDFYEISDIRKVLDKYRTRCPVLLAFLTYY